LSHFIVIACIFQNSGQTKIQHEKVLFVAMHSFILQSVSENTCIQSKIALNHMQRKKKPLS